MKKSTYVKISVAFYLFELGAFILFAFFMVARAWRGEWMETIINAALAGFYAWLAKRDWRRIQEAIK